MSHGGILAFITSRHISEIWEFTGVPKNIFAAKHAPYGNRGFTGPCFRVELLSWGYGVNVCCSRLKNYIRLSTNLRFA